MSTTVTVTVPNHLMPRLVGPLNENLRLVEDAFEGTSIHARGNEFTIDGDDAALAARLVDELRLLLEQGHSVDPQVVHRTIDMVRADERPSEVLTAEVLRSARGRSVRPKTSGQKRYAEAIRDSIITFGIGPAGTGKSYLAVALAVQALQEKKVDRIILTRPAVEAGERLGFLPGDLMAKIDPYLRPLYDALYDMMGTEAARRLIEAGTVEVAPLAYMRGRAQPVDTPVLTPDGFRPIGSLTVGDLVVGSDGHPTPVLGVYPQGRKPVWRVSSQDGAGTLACGDHLWFVRTRGDMRHGKPGRIVRTSDMVGRERTFHYRTFELPLVGPVQFRRREVPLDPYALGLLLGDGCITLTTTPTFCTADPELAMALEEALPDIELARKSSGIDYALRHIHGGRGRRAGGTVVANPVTEAIRLLGIGGTRSGTKFVPPEYLYNSFEVRLALLQGLLDTDGGPVRQKDRSCRVHFSTTSARLRDDVLILVRSVGGVAYSRTRPAAGRPPGGTRDRPVAFRNDAHVLDIRLPKGIAPFRLSRKKAVYDAAGGGGRPMRFVDRVEPVGEAECVCIAVGAADSLYVTEDFIVTHNTLNNSFIILDEAQNTTPEQMKMFLTRIGFGSRVVVTGDDTQVDLPGGRSGLLGLETILSGIEGLSWVRLGRRDVVRHKIVADIVNAYEAADTIRDA
ncbi:MAG TPA: PhoH family protein [Acidimicrobiales bacterium]|nr:PhoH family protein [Acidimicrobiales bacterium]